MGTPDEAPRILVVCYGNLCRSPMAAGLLRRRLPAANVRSAGTNAIGGDPPTPYAVDTMQKLAGIDISASLSHRLGVADLEAADHVLAMSTQQAHLAAALAPDATERIRLLGAFAPAARDGAAADPGGIGSSRVEIPDPIFGDLEEFAACLERLREATDRFAEWLEAGADPTLVPPALDRRRWQGRAVDA